MRIAQIAPLYESVPPTLYGGTERVVSYLTEELVEQGHDVTLFASGDSITRARLVPACSRALRLQRESVIDPLAHHIRLIERVYCEVEAGNFDVLHFHIDYLHFPLTRRKMTPNITTLHGRLDLPDLVPLYREFNEMNLVSISNSQRTPLPWANWRATVYHGLPENSYILQETPGKYLAFLGRIAPEKRVDRAIEIAKRAGIPLKVAAKIDKADQEYFDAHIRPLFDDPIVEYIGEIGDHEKNHFLGNAYALLFPIDWSEPFGLVMIEAMACGTPVIAWRMGSVPEVIEHETNGYIVNNVDEAVRAVERIGDLSRTACRKTFLERFTVRGMAANYANVYSAILGEKSHDRANAVENVWQNGIAAYSTVNDAGSY